MAVDETTPHPQLQGALFEAVQQRNVFEDSKRFVDSVPSTQPSDISRKFEEQQSNPVFDLRSFVDEHFEVAGDATPDFQLRDGASMEEHIDLLWPFLTVEQKQANEYDSLISLPNPHVVPGGRFREVYYWDSYFTARGLIACDRYDAVRDMVDNFASLIDRFGFIPNGNRRYYLSRSQLPLFCSMVELLEREEGFEAVRPYLPQIEREYEFWMDGQETVSADSPTHRHVVQLDDGTVLNRYWDDTAAPRAESYREDIELAESVPKSERDELYRHIRAACESGWDFSSRWFADSTQLSSIRTTDLIPIDLNATLYNIERRLAEWFSHEGETTKAAAYQQAAETRLEAINEYCWDPDAGFYFDYCWADGEQTETWSLAAVVPLYFGVSSHSQATEVAETLRERFLEPGGLVTTLSETGEQWDAPNGWAPLQWMAVAGLRRYGFDELADEIDSRWVALNEAVFREDRKMVEKYDVSTSTLKGGGGEYPLQDGFGWTNGVVMALHAARQEETESSTPEPRDSEPVMTTGQ